MDKEYKNLLKRLYSNGFQFSSGRRSLYGEYCCYDLRKKIPSVRKFSEIVHETLWLISGDTNTKYLRGKGIKSWDCCANGWGELCPVNEEQWNKMPENLKTKRMRVLPKQQLKRVIKELRASLGFKYRSPAIIAEDTVEDCCRCLLEFNSNGGYLNLRVYQHSSQAIKDIPHSVVSYSLLLNLVAQVTGLKPGTFTHNYGVIWASNMALSLQTEGPIVLRNSKLWLNPEIEDIDDFTHDDIDLETTPILVKLLRRRTQWIQQERN